MCIGRKGKSTHSIIKHLLLRPGSSIAVNHNRHVMEPNGKGFSAKGKIDMQRKVVTKTTKEQQRRLDGDLWVKS